VLLLLDAKPHHATTAASASAAAAAATIAVAVAVSAPAPVATARHTKPTHHVHEKAVSHSCIRVDRVHLCLFAASSAGSVMAYLSRSLSRSLRRACGDAERRLQTDAQQHNSKQICFSRVVSSASFRR